MIDQRRDMRDTYNSYLFPFEFYTRPSRSNHHVMPEEGEQTKPLRVGESN